MENFLNELLEIQTEAVQKVVEFSANPNADYWGEGYLTGSLAQINQVIDKLKEHISKNSA